MGRPLNNIAVTLEKRTERLPWSGCWIWLGGSTSQGYGRISFNDRMFGTHRLAWELRNGQIPDGFIVCHRCDVPSCINPDHLFLGTYQDNMRDKFNKGRGNNAKKLTPEIVVAIRGDTRTHRAIGSEYGVSHGVISKIISRKLWAHIP